MNASQNSPSGNGSPRRGRRHFTAQEKVAIVKRHLIDGVLVNGSARLVGAVAGRIRLWQTGYLFQYAFAMIIGLISILAIWVVY